MIVRETISFERGKDPKKSMNIGKESLMKYDFDSYGSALDWLVRNLDIVTDGKYIPGDPIRVSYRSSLKLPEDLSLYVQKWAKDARIEGSQGIITYANLLREMIPTFKKHGMYITESVNFERGKEPKETMRIGKYAKVSEGDILDVWFDGAFGFDNIKPGWYKVQAHSDEEYAVDDDNEFFDRWFDGVILDYESVGGWLVGYDEDDKRWVIEDQ